jgi:lysozyme
MGVMEIDAITVAAMVAAGVMLAYRSAGQAMSATDTAEPDQLPDTWDTLTTTFDPMTYYTGTTDASTADSNVSAFLNMIANAEGTAGEKGYQTMFGYHYFYSFADHPRQYWDFTDLAGRQLKSSAAGRYQIIIKTWDALKDKLNLVDFSPESQDAAAIELIRERGALADVQAGRIEDAIRKCAPVWASLPGAGYNQPERQLTSLLTTYQQSGGTFA